jgi:hypothetical protein
VLLENSVNFLLLRRKSLKCVVFKKDADFVGNKSALEIWKDSWKKEAFIRSNFLETDKVSL